MILLMVRHAIAQEREDFVGTEKSDFERPLTEEGIQKMQLATLGLKKITPHIDFIATSPYFRALQTAKIISKEYPGAEFIPWEELGCGVQTQTLIEKLKPLSHKVVMIVGHEPDFGKIFCDFCAGSTNSARVPYFYSFKKGAVVCVEFYNEIEAGKAVLLWALKPAHLRSLSTAK